MTTLQPISQPAWLLLVVSLPTSAATPRMRLWRGVKALGGAALRDGAYLLPNVAGLRAQLQALADDAASEDGKVWILSVQAADAKEDAEYRALFDRSSEYTAWMAELSGARATLGTAGEAELLRIARRQGRGFDAIRKIDFFPNEASARAEAHWRDFNAAIDIMLSPGEPHGVAGNIPRRDPSQYQGRRWATRRHLWVDRVACAWLIRRFIDPHATFLWLDDVRQCPDDVLGFDFDGATFTHIGDRVSFEVLLASFGLDEDKGLARLGQMIHVLDIGGTPIAEASGFEAVLAGARERFPDDDALLDEVGHVLDSLHTHYSSPRKR
ncbi:chromate resistance protein ChrB domain-containing protein [Cupriavidus pinatubonensis]|uniref:Protein ChrB n=1 Tax=Cupriavidus pinatubonensis TaxID=248026 RepID=A0ABM8Y102_9BURK|nr:chromate resistance protein ChrB domain-containing protein [Cupriavidus pinatubonensis]CAG9186406.1 Protein ChrB [Cupriavidus pinatubonensis]